MRKPHGDVMWTELMTRDLQGALKYYRAVCGWHFQPFPLTMPGGGTYYIGSKGDKPVIGVLDLNTLPDTDHMAPQWFSYFAVRDLDAALKQSEAAGGTIQRPPFEVPHIGRIAIVTDPTGASLGLIVPA
ncbi:VOC family protein [Rhodovulum adriaticum]|uniref:VOC domain-containing protein n=1 Tax=Rhodovulum adriaticum TaxID=35804 RepID=A0A4R2NL27_RHOAD|nr:VOC family protein [Rhodovulum adriaticum]MBK1635196.1 hypothetical protein [Rhodovulum adriaticum]TCP22309.1 hypothetical protein EV656_107119 [Rhodovulum adriaticum]